MKRRRGPALASTREVSGHWRFRGGSEIGDRRRRWLRIGPRGRPEMGGRTGGVGAGLLFGLLARRLDTRRRLPRLDSCHLGCGRGEQANKADVVLWTGFEHDILGRWYDPRGRNRGWERSTLGLHFRKNVSDSARTPPSCHRSLFCFRRTNAGVWVRKRPGDALERGHRTMSACNRHARRARADPERGNLTRRLASGFSGRDGIIVSDVFTGRERKCFSYRRPDDTGGDVLRRRTDADRDESQRDHSALGHLHGR